MLNFKLVQAFRSPFNSLKAGHIQHGQALWKKIIAVRKGLAKTIYLSSPSRILQSCMPLTVWQSVSIFHCKKKKGKSTVMKIKLQSWMFEIFIMCLFHYWLVIQCWTQSSTSQLFRNKQSYLKILHTCFCIHVCNFCVAEVKGKIIICFLPVFIQTMYYHHNCPADE